MPELLLETSEELMRTQEEPPLEIALPQVFIQPPLITLQQARYAHVDQLVERLHQCNHQRNGGVSPGPDYQALVNEFQPLFNWAMSCWDYLLSTEGCRFVLRSGQETLYARGHYRAVTHKDFSRLIHRVFRQCVLEFSRQPFEGSFAGFLRTHFWDAVVRAYRRLEDPPDPRQRKLTPYSYLRCIPYRFLNDFHQGLVYQTIDRLAHLELQAIRFYFLNFMTFHAAASTMHLPVESVEEVLRRGLLTLLVQNRLVYCLLRQIERY